MNIQSMAKQMNDVERLDKPDVTEVLRSICPGSDIQEQALRWAIKSIPALQSELSAAREALQAAARLVDKWRDDAEHLMKLSDVVIEHVGMARQHDADELAATLQRDRQP